MADALGGERLWLLLVHVEIGLALPQVLLLILFIIPHVLNDAQVLTQDLGLVLLLCKHLTVDLLHGIVGLWPLTVKVTALPFGEGVLHGTVVGGFKLDLLVGLDSDAVKYIFVVDLVIVGLQSEVAPLALGGVLALILIVAVSLYSEVLGVLSFVLHHDGVWGLRVWALACSLGVPLAVDLLANEVIRLPLGGQV